jgi:hypothetical protein
MSTSYETDVIAWANEQAVLLRDGRLAEIDIEPIRQAAPAAKNRPCRNSI